MILVDNRNTPDPYINLAIEEYLTRNATISGQDLLLLYINEPCIVLGKNQSIYREINFEFLRNDKLKIARRISGGGTVYHDAGNLNFSIISPFADEKVNNYKYFNQGIVDALHKAWIDAFMDKRNNILFNWRKISGNAQFTNRKNIISHGTLLFNANLDVLRKCLKENDFKIETKAVKSVRGSVINLNEITTRLISVTELKDFLIKELTEEKPHIFNNDEWKLIEQLAEEKFKTFDWVYGRSPLTTIKKSEVDITVENGRITQINNLSSSIAGIEKLTGLKYQYSEIKKALENHSNASELLTLIF